MNQLKKISLLSLATLALAACTSLPDSISFEELQKKFQSHTQSPIKASDNPLDFAIDGVGYFAVIDPKTGKRMFTHQGKFKLDNNRQIVTQEGFILDPAISLPADTEIVISEGGTVWALTQDKLDTQLGRLTLTRFTHPENLKKMDGHEGYYEMTSASGDPEEGQPGQNFFGLMMNKALEDLSKPQIKLPTSPCLTPSEKRKTTDNKLDWYIQGQGYFTFVHPATGERLFTRKAQIQTNPNGQLVSEHGYNLDPAITLPAVSKNGEPLETEFTQLKPNGDVWAKGPTGQEILLGKITLALVDKPEDLQAFSYTRQTVLRFKDPEKKAQDVQPGEGGSGTVHVGAYEDCGSDLLTFPAEFYQTHVSGGL